MVNLTKYTPKAVLQLLKSSNSFNAILPNYTNAMVSNWLSSRYNLTSEQITYILNNI